MIELMADAAGADETALPGPRRRPGRLEQEGSSAPERARKADRWAEGSRIPDAALKPLELLPAGSSAGFKLERRPRLTMIERLGPGCALGTDGLQWIVLEAKGQAEPGRSDSWQGLRWDAVAFIHSSKEALIEAIASKGLKLSPGGQDAIDRQDARIYRWHAIDADPAPFATLPGEVTG